MPQSQIDNYIRGFDYSSISLVDRKTNKGSHADREIVSSDELFYNTTKQFSIMDETYRVIARPTFDNLNGEWSVIESNVSTNLNNQNWNINGNWQGESWVFNSHSSFVDLNITYISSTQINVNGQLNNFGLDNIVSRPKNIQIDGTYESTISNSGRTPVLNIIIPVEQFSATIGDLGSGRSNSVRLQFFAYGHASLDILIPYIRGGNKVFKSIHLEKL
jgi:hypothetical protein